MFHKNHLENLTATFLLLNSAPPMVRPTVKPTIKQKYGKPDISAKQTKKT